MAVPGQRRSPRPRTLGLGVTAAVAALVLAACGSGSSSSSGSSITELDYYSDQQGSAAWQQVLDGCQQQTGVTVKRQSLPTDQLLPRLLQAGPHSLPDLAFTDNPTLQQVASTGALTPLTDYGFSAAGYAQSIVQAGTYQGKIYGLAPGVNGLALIYNKDLLTAAGIQPPTTWDELKADATKLTRGSQYGLAFSAVATEEGTWQFLPFFWSNGGDLSKLDSPQGVQALQYVSDLVSDGSTSKSVLTWNQNDVADQFVAGNAAMMINGSWNLARLDSTANLHYGVVPIPVPQAGKQPVVALGGEVGIIPATGDATQQAAAKVLSCILSDKTMSSWDKGHAYVPSKTSVATTFGQQNPEMQPFVSEVATARSRTAQLGDKYAKVSTALGAALQSALTGQQSPQQALTQAQQQATGS
ncbi:MAG TPA: extracellular solute-binding protein [Pseudonocardiaceae bacterium]|jgi:multiple sugar transport system substrate-binding protein|nr:extracellular solute-binding protein [Pseudonocardiaceae bacterium]